VFINLSLPIFANPILMDGFMNTEIMKMGLDYLGNNINF
jgi:hypothetical protein